MIDFIETRGDLDADRIGMWGISLGGYYAPRAAAFDRRIKACLALGGPFDWASVWDGLPALTREAFRVRSHCATEADAKRNAATLSLNGIAKNITCPIYIVNGRQDRIVPCAEPSGSPAKRRSGDAQHRRGRQPHRQQPRLSLAPTVGGLAGGCAGLMGSELR